MQGESAKVVEWPLSRLPAGSRGRITAVAGGRGMAARLSDMGLRAGSEIEVGGGGVGRGPVYVLSDGVRLGLGRGMAGRIMVARSDGALAPTLADAREGDVVRVVRVGGGGAIRQRLLDMGILREVELTVERYAPLRDPLQIMVKGYALALRVADARNIATAWVVCSDEGLTEDDKI